MFHNCISKLQAFNNSVSKLPQYYYKFEKAVLTAIDRFLEKYHEDIYIIYTDIYLCFFLVFFARLYSYDVAFASVYSYDVASASVFFARLYSYDVAFACVFLVLSIIFLPVYYMNEYYEKKKTSIT